MTADPGEPKKEKTQYAFNLTLAAIAGQVGCLTLIVILGALFGGLWLDQKFDSRPVFTIILMIASIPFTVAGMFWVVRKATSKMKSSIIIDTDTNTEDDDSGKDT